MKEKKKRTLEAHVAEATTAPRRREESEQSPPTTAASSTTAGVVHTRSHASITTDGKIGFLLSKITSPFKKLFRPKKSVTEKVAPPTRPVAEEKKILATAKQSVEEKKGVQPTGEQKTKKEETPLSGDVNDEAAKKARKLLQKEAARKRKRKKRTSLEQKRALEALLRKAGREASPDKVKKGVFYVTLGLVAAFTIVTLVLGSIGGKSASGLLLFYLGVWTAVFGFVYLFNWMVVYIYLDLRIYSRTRQVEEVLPDFLQLASANISAGMPVDRALWFAIRPNFGVLAKEIEEVAKSTLAGEELSESLTKFTEKYDSLILKRSVNILLEGLDSGGEMADLLNKVALNIQEMRILRKEMSANVTTYAIFITFACIVMAPVLFALATQLLTIIISITSKLDMNSSTSSLFTISMNSSPKMVGDFKLFSALMLSISALMSAAIVSVIKHGRVKEGLRNLPIFLVVSLLIYVLATIALKSLLSGIA